MALTPAPGMFAKIGRLRREPLAFLMVMAFANFLGFAGWNALFNNFAKEAAAFTGAEIGLAQTVREIPGFLAFSAIFVLMLLREQVLAFLALAVMGLGVGLTGQFPSLSGLLMTTFIMSVGFHYFETVNQSLALQLFDKAAAPRLMGKVSGAMASAQFVAYGGIAVLWWSGWRDYASLFWLLGGAVIVIAGFSALFFARFEGPVAQNRGIILRKRYGLYYALTLMSGARRQIFVAFAGFLLVEKFKFSVPEIAMLMLVVSGLNTFIAPRMGLLIGLWGERRTITLENVSLIVIFLGYAFTNSGMIAAGLFILDGLFVTWSIAQRTYLQKIGDPADMAPTAACAFTINHIAAVFIPVTFGLVWLKNPQFVFLLGAGIASISLSLSFLVPRHPAPGNETVFSRG